MRTRRWLAAGFAVAGMCGAGLAGASESGSAEGGGATVQPGESIQAALDAAEPGDTITVAAGTYHEYLQISTDGVTLQGDGAVLEPPDDEGAATNDCSSEDDKVGICVIGDVTFPTDPDGQVTIDRTVSDVTLRGFTVQGFAGSGVFAFATDGFVAEHNVFGDNGGYGVFANTSTDVTYRYNMAFDNTEAGYYIGDSPDANAVVQWNAGYDNGDGLLFRDALGGTIDHNAFYWNCIGILVLDTGAPGAAGDVTITGNALVANNQACEGDEDEGVPPTSGIGLAILGGTGVDAHGNRITYNSPSGATPASGGVVLLSSAAFGGSDPTDNAVTGNQIQFNQPDVATDGTGSGNTLPAGAVVVEGLAGPSGPDQNGDDDGAGAPETSEGTGDDSGGTNGPEAGDRTGDTGSDDSGSPHDSGDDTGTGGPMTT
jgi:hypothetical protein